MERSIWVAVIRFAGLAGLLDDALLNQRHFLQGHLRPQVAAGHHHPVHHGQYLAEAIQGAGLRYLGDEHGVRSMLVYDLQQGR